MGEVEQTAAAELDEATRDMLLRLRRLEGQVRGLQRMLGERRDCAETLAQYLAVRAALDEIGARLLDAEIGRCLEGAGPQGERVRAMLRLWLRVAG